MSGCRCYRLRQHLCAALFLVLCLFASAVRSKQLAVLVQPLSSTAGEPLSLQPVVALTDDSGNILTSESDGTVSVSIGNNPSRFAVMWPTDNTFTFVNGIARCSGLYINEAATGYTLVLSSFYHGVRTETSSFDVVVGPRYRLAILADISTAYGGTAFLPQPTAGVVDKGGNVVTATNEGTVRIEIEVNPVGGLLLPAAVLNTSIVNGSARFRGVFIDVAGSPYKLRYTTDLALDGGSTVVTNPFTVAQGVCNKVVIVSSPRAAEGGKAFTLQPVLKLIDSGGNTLEGDSSSLVRVSIATNPSRGTLKPTDALTAYVRNGFAMFRGLKIDKAGSGYSLRFSVYNKVEGKNQWKKLDIQNVTATFDVLTGSPVSLYLLRNFSDGVLDGQPNEVQPIVALLDSGGNIASSLRSGFIAASMVSSASVSSSIVVDTSTAPLLTVVSVRAAYSMAYPMPYGVGARISIIVTFSDEVTVKGAPTLELATSTGGVGANGNAVCTAISNMWSTSYVFEYDVVATDSTADLEYASTMALSLNGGIITDRTGKPPILTLPALGSVSSLSGTSAVVIDTTPPVITAVTCTNPGNGEFGTGQKIYLNVQFSQPVVVYGSPILAVALTTVGSGGSRFAVFASGNNTNILAFLYTVQNGDAASILDVTTDIDVNGGFIKHFSQRPTTDAIVTMSTVSMKLSSANSISIDTTVPTIDATVGVTSGSANGIYAPGDTLAIQVTFTKPVVVTGYPRLFLETGPIKRPAGYTSGSGSKVLTFVYRVSAGDTSGGGFLNYRDALALSLNDGTITRHLVDSSGAVGVPAVLSLADSTNAGKALMNNAQLTVDGLPPVVTGISVSSGAPTTVTRDNEVVISVSFSSLVTVYTTKGTPSLQMEVGDYNREAVYSSGNNTQALLFSYIVRLGDKAPSGANYRSQSALVLNGGMIRRASKSPTLDANLALPSPPSLSPTVIVDPALAFVTSITRLSADVVTGTYGVKQAITLSLTFSDEVALSGSTPPSLKLNTGTVVPYTTGSSTSALVFTYIVKDIESTSSLDKFDDNALICTAPACQIINYNAQSVSLSLSGVSLLPVSIVVDTSAPKVVSVYAITPSPTVNGGVFVVGDVIEVVVKMNLDVFIDPPPSAYPEKAPLLLLNSVKGGKPVLCRGYVNGDRRLLLFKYVVELGDVAFGLTYVSQSALTLNSGQCSIKRFSTTPTTDAVLTLPLPVPLGVSLNVDTTTVPTVLSVTSPNANGIYRSGDRLTLTVLFSQHVVVRGSPFLWVDVGIVSRKAVYESGSSTTLLTFIYTVQEDDFSMDLEYVDHHSLDTSSSVGDGLTTAILHMSTIPTTQADVNLPYPFTQGSLGYSKNIQVNGRKPSISSIGFVSADGLYSVGQKVIIEVTFSSCVVIDRGPLGVLGPPRLRLQPSPVSSVSASPASTITRYGVYVSGSPGTALRFEYTIRTGDTARSLDYADTGALDVNGARILTCTASANVAPTQNANLHLNPPGGRLLGTTAKPITLGKATFTDLVVDRLGFGYRVKFYTLYNQSMLETTADFSMVSSAAYGLRSSPYASGDNLGSSVDIDGDTLVLGGPGANEPIAAVQIVTALGDSTAYTNEIQVLQTSAVQQPAVQILTSAAAPGETIGGWFYLKLGFLGPTRRIPFNADPIQMSVALELDLGFDPQTISVSREPNTYCACSNGFVWYITFLYAEGPLEALVAIQTQLTGRSVSIGDGRGGNTAAIAVPSTNVGGAIVLQRGNNVTRNIRCDVDEVDLATILMQDLDLNIWSISRAVSSAMNTYTWRITFTASDTLYDVPQLIPQGVLLTGHGAKLKVRTERNGQGRLSGVFRLRFRTDLFPNDETNDIPVNATDRDVEIALEKLVSVNDVSVQRTTSMNAFGGFSWTVTFVQVNAKNNYGPVVDTSGNLPALVPDTTKLKGTNARVTVQVGGYEPSTLTADGLGTNWGLPGGSAGMVAVFARGNFNDWKQQGGTIKGNDTRGGDLFGTSVSVQGNHLVVGAPAAAIFGDFEKQSLLCDADGGYLRLSFSGKSSVPIPFDAGMQDLQAAIADMMSVSYGEVQIATSFTSLCGAVEIIIALRAGDHGDDWGNIADILVDSNALTKSGGIGSAQMHEYTTGTFRSDGIYAKGMQCGAAYIFLRDAVQSTWSQEAKLSPPTGSIVDIHEFGASVSFSYPFAVVGAPGAFGEEGRVFVYQRTSAGKWALFQTLSAAPHVIKSGDRFGEAVAISGLITTTVVVGAPGYATDSGAVFVFDLVGGYFQSRQMLLQESPVLAPGDRFGNAVDLDMFSTYTLVVGAYRHNFYRVGAIDAVDSGLALVFTRHSSNDVLFSLQQVLYGSDTRANDRFGTSVAVAKDTIIVGQHELYKGTRTIRKPVQVITTSVLDSETTGIIQGGSFVLSFLRSSAGENPTPATILKRVKTQSLAFNISSSELEAILQRDFEMANIIVRRDGPSTSMGYTWYVTFADSTGEIPLLNADSTNLLGAEATVTWSIRMAPVLRGSAYAFTRDTNGKWTEQATLFPRNKQYFAWFGSAVAVDKRAAIVGAPNLDTYVTGINSGGGFVFDLGILSLQFSSKAYSVLEGDTLDVTVQRCNRYGAFCAVDVSAAPQLYINYDTGDAFSDRQSGRQTFVAVNPQVGPYRKLSMLDAAGSQGLASVFFAKNVASQEPFPLSSKGRWLSAASVGTANGRNQFYGSSELRSLWVDALFDYAGTSDYCSSTGELYFDGMDDLTHTFSVLTTSDYVVENPDETVMLRLSLPGIWPSATGNLWSTLTIKDNGDGGSGARSYLAHMNAHLSSAQSYSDFGTAVSVFSAGNVAVVGAPMEATEGGVKCGAVHFFVRRSGFWERDATIFPSDCAPNMRFGTSVAIDGSLGPVRAIIGAPGSDAAYIYLYSRNSLTPTTRWVKEVRLNEPSAASVDINHNFGGPNAVSIFGDVAVVGASGLERVFVYHRGITGLWALVATLRASDHAQYRILERTVEQEYAFGQALDMDRRTIIVGAPFSDGGAFTAQQYHNANFDHRFFGRGAAYIFHLESQEQVITIRTSSPLTSGSFRLTATRRGLTGTTREISYGSTAADVKAALEGTNGRDGDGSTVEALGFRLLEVTRTGMIDQGFLWRVTFIGEVMSIPVMKATWSGYGCRSCTTFSSSYAVNPSRQVEVVEVVQIGSTWKQQTRIMAPNGNSGDQFGFSVAISGEQTIVGAASSSALTTTTWNFETGDLTGWLTTGTAFDQQPTYGDNSYARINTYRSYQSPGAAPPGQSAHHEGRYWVGTFEARNGAGKAMTAAQEAAQMCAFANDELCRAPSYKLPSADMPAGATQGDGPQGTLISLPFTIEGSWMSFRVGGGCDVRVVYVELLIDGQSAAVPESVAAEQIAVEVAASGSTIETAYRARPTSATSKLRATGRCDETMQEVTWDLSAFQNRTAQIRVVDASSSVVWGHINFDDVRFSWGQARVAQASTSKAGEAYTFRRRAPGMQFPTAKCEGMNRWLCEWEFQARLIASDRSGEDRFGFRVAVDDTTGLAVIAAPGQRAVDANNTIEHSLIDGLDVTEEGLAAMEEVGSVYVYHRADEVRDGAGVLLRTPRWSPKEVLKMQYPQKQRQSRFGAAISLDSTDLLVGAPGISLSPVLPQAGRAFAYDLAVAGVRFTNPWFSCIEGNPDGLVGLTLSRSAASSNLTRALTIGYATEDRSATGVDAMKFAACLKVPSTQRKDCGDYQQAAGEVTFAAGETSKLVTVPIMEDACFEQWEEHFVVRLHVPGGEPLLGEHFIARVRIDDDDFNGEAC